MVPTVYNDWSLGKIHDYVLVVWNSENIYDVNFFGCLWKSSMSVEFGNQRESLLRRDPIIFSFERAILGEDGTSFRDRQVLWSRKVSK